MILSCGCNAVSVTGGYRGTTVVVCQGCGIMFGRDAAIRNWYRQCGEMVRARRRIAENVAALNVWRAAVEFS